MKRYDVRDKAVVVVLSRKEAIALCERTQERMGLIKSKILLSAEAKLMAAIQDAEKYFASSKS
jgi:hypothetical protein